MRWWSEARAAWCRSVPQACNHLIMLLRTWMMLRERGRRAHGCPQLTFQWLLESKWVLCRSTGPMHGRSQAQGQLASAMTGNRVWVRAWSATMRGCRTNATQAQALASLGMSWPSWSPAPGHLKEKPSTLRGRCLVDRKRLHSKATELRTRASSPVSLSSGVHTTCTQPCIGSSRISFFERCVLFPYLGWESN